MDGELLNGLLDEARSKRRIREYVIAKNKGKIISQTLTGICPVCRRRTLISRDERFYCLSCGRTGDIFRLMALTEGKQLRDVVLSAVPGIREVLEREEETILAVNRAASEHFIRSITTEGLKYIRERKLSDDDMEEFGIGFAPMGKDLLLKVLRKDFTEDEILEAGVAVQTEDGLVDRFRNRVIFPIRKRGGDIVGFGGRAAGNWKPKYLNTPTGPCFDKKNLLFGVDRLDPFQEVIICEGYMDAIALKKNGFNTAAVLGTAFGEGHIPLVKDCGTVYVATDSDVPGTVSARKAVSLLLEYGINAKRIDFSPVKDPDEFINRFGAEKVWEKMRNAENGERFLVRTAGDDGVKQMIRVCEREGIPEF